ncbi:unnamed protein product, partial [Phaeothamnion confervicola]
CEKLSGVGKSFAFIRNLPGCYFYPAQNWTAEYRQVAELSAEEHERHMEAGYFRQGQSFYTTVCDTCQECIPIRIPVGAFRPHKSQRRILRDNADLRVEVRKPSFSLAKFQLFQKYQKERWNMPVQHPEELFHYMLTDWGGAWEFSYWEADRLLGFGILDEMPDSGNSRYFVYDCEKARGLGIFSLLQELEWCQQHGKTHLYLGMYVPSHPSMDYKASFRPFELRLRPDGWMRFA